MRQDSGTRPFVLLPSSLRKEARRSGGRDCSLLGPQLAGLLPLPMRSMTMMVKACMEEMLVDCDASRITCCFTCSWICLSCNRTSGSLENLRETATMA